MAAAMVIDVTAFEEGEPTASTNYAKSRFTAAWMSTSRATRRAFNKIGRAGQTMWRRTPLVIKFGLFFVGYVMLWCLAYIALLLAFMHSLLMGVIVLFLIGCLLGAVLMAANNT